MIGWFTLQLDLKANDDKLLFPVLINSLNALTNHLHSSVDFLVKKTLINTHIKCIHKLNLLNLKSLPKIELTLKLTCLFDLFQALP